MKRRKRKQTKNRVMSIQVLLVPDPHFITCVLKRAEPINLEELKLTKGDETLVGHLRAVNGFCTEQMGVDVTRATNIVMERGFCVHGAYTISPAITIDCKSMIEWEGAVIQRKGNRDPKQRIIEIQTPVDITPDWYKRTIACATFRKLKVLTKDETIRLISAIVAMPLPYYALPQDIKKHRALGKSFTSAPVEWTGDKRWDAEYDLFLLENFPDGKLP